MFDTQFFIHFPVKCFFNRLTIVYMPSCGSIPTVGLNVFPGTKESPVPFLMGFSSGSDNKESACNAGDLGLIPRSGRSPEEVNGYPLQYSCLEYPVDRGAWWATVHGSQSQT